MESKSTSAKVLLVFDSLPTLQYSVRGHSVLHLTVFNVGHSELFYCMQGIVKRGNEKGLSSECFEQMLARAVLVPALILNEMDKPQQLFHMPRKNVTQQRWLDLILLAYITLPNSDMHIRETGTSSYRFLIKTNRRVCRASHTTSCCCARSFFISTFDPPHGPFVYPWGIGYGHYCE